MGAFKKNCRGKNLMKLLRYLIALLISIFIIATSYAATTWQPGKRYYYKCTGGLTGGGTSVLDAIAGVSISPKDTAIVTGSGNTTYHYNVYDSGTTVGVESSPLRIVPDDLQAGGTGITGTTTWRLSGYRVSGFQCADLQVGSISWDDGSGNMAQAVVRAAVTSSVFDKSTDEIENILSGTSDQMILYNASGAAIAADPASAREALGAQEYDATNVVDGDFTDNGIMTRTGAGSYVSGDTNNAAPTGTWDFSGGVSTSADTPTDNSHVATKKYVDDNAGGGGSGSGLTTIQVDDGNEAIAATLDDAPSGIFMKGDSGVSTSASGNTVYIGIDWTGTTTQYLAGVTENPQPVLNWVTDGHSDWDTASVWKTKANGVKWLEDTSGNSIFVVDSSGYYWLMDSGGVTHFYIDPSGVTLNNAGFLRIDNGAAGGAAYWFEGTNNGNEAIQIKAPDALGANYQLTLPQASGTSGQKLAVGATGNLTFSNENIIEGEIDYSSGTSIASAVTKFKSFTVNDCQDIGGGSAASPFRLFAVPTCMYPDGVFLVYWELSAQHGSSISINGDFSEWSSGSSTAFIGDVWATSNTGPKEHNLLSGATCVIEAGNEVFFHLENTSGVSMLSGTIGFMPR